MSVMGRQMVSPGLRLGLVPLAMSLAALALVVGHVAVYGITQPLEAGARPDEGTAAHLFQLLLAGQLPLIAYFALTRLPSGPVATLAMLALQATAGLAGMLLVIVLEP